MTTGETEVWGFGRGDPLRLYLEALVGGQKDYFDEKITAFDRRYHERHEADLKAIEHHINLNDLRYQQRFESQEQNLSTAITAQEKAVSAALAAAEKAVGKAEIAAEKRFDAVNEFRGQLSDQARDFMPRAESELTTKAMAEKIENIQGLLGSIGGRSDGLKEGWGYLVGALGALIGIVSLIIALTH